MKHIDNSAEHRAEDYGFLYLASKKKKSMTTTGKT
jgi:hypothetical protein